MTNELSRNEIAALLWQAYYGSDQVPVWDNVPDDRREAYFAQADFLRSRVVITRRQTVKVVRSKDPRLLTFSEPLTAHEGEEIVIDGERAYVRPIH